MPFNSSISRTDAAALIPEEAAREIITHLPDESAALARFRHVPMSRAQLRIPAESALAMAYFVNGDTGLKQTSESAWTNLYLNAEELAAIVPVPENVFDDVDYDIWALIRPQLVEAIGRVLDAAIFFGTNKPASWPQAVVPAAIAAGNVAVQGTNTAEQGGIVGDISDAFATVEADGFDVDGIVADRTMRGKLRQTRGTTGEQLQTGNGTDAEQAAATVYGVPISYAMPGMWPAGPSSPEAVVGDFTQGMLGVRSDLTWKILDQAVLTDAAGAIQYNLAQQDMIAIRVTARFAFQVANPITYSEPDAAKRYPFGVLETAAA